MSSHHPSFVGRIALGFGLQEPGTKGIAQPLTELWILLKVGGGLLVNVETGLMIAIVIERCTQFDRALDAIKDLEDVFAGAVLEDRYVVGRDFALYVTRVCFDDTRASLGF